MEVLSMRRRDLEKRLDIAMMVVAALAVISLVGKSGFGLGSGAVKFFYYLDGLIILLFVANAVARLFNAANWWKYIKKHPTQYVLIALFISQMLIAQLLLTDIGYKYVLNQLNLIGIAKIYIVLMQVYILLELFAEIGRLNIRMANLPLPPATIFVTGFLVLIATGTIMLLLPGATSGKSIKFIDALFTSTSATCVTGLIVVPTGTFFTRFGHIVILILIQFGGLGLMTFGTFFALVFRQEFGLRERMLLGDVLNVQVFSKIKNLLAAIIGITFGLEAIGAVLMYFSAGPYAAKMDSRLFWSIFHSISAFCNAGFSIWNDNISRFTHDWKMTFIFAALIIFGGLGFIVLSDIGKYIFSSVRYKRRKVPHFTLQTRVVIATSAILIFGGMIFLLIGDTNGQFRGLGAPAALLTSFFQSVTARTAGFNTINVGKLAAGPLLVTIILMFIGASPGSTGGGVKSTTIAVIVAAIRDRLLGRRKVNMFKRSLPTGIVGIAAMIIVLAFAVISIGTFLLCTFELGKHPEWSFIDMLFEEVSAFATVGLSTGPTFDLSAASKLVIILTMFIGRIGPLTFLFAVSRHVGVKRMEHIEESVMVG